MIASLRGAVIEADGGRVVIEAAGVGYEVHVTPHTASRLGAPGKEAFLLVVESTALYGGSTSLYGFLNREEKQLFHLLRELPGTGAKKALEALDKASRSFPDFRRAVAGNDVAALVKIFGFSRKTAEKLAAGLKDSLVPAGGHQVPLAPVVESGPSARALEALAALGYKPAESRTALDSVRRDNPDLDTPVEELVRQALRRL